MDGMPQPSGCDPFINTGIFKFGGHRHPKGVKSFAAIHADVLFDPGKAFRQHTLTQAFLIPIGIGAHNNRRHGYDTLPIGGFCLGQMKAGHIVFQHHLAAGYPLRG